MSYMQWFAEYHALKRVDKEKVELISKVMEIGIHSIRELFVGLLGLNLIHKKALEAEGTEVPEGVTPFVPMSFLVSRPEILKQLMEDMEKADSAERGVTDDAFDAWSRDLQQRLESGDMGDMEPLLGPVYMDPKERWTMPANLDLLRNLGVKITGEEEENRKKQIRKDIDEIVKEVVPELGKPTVIRQTTSGDLPSEPPMGITLEDLGAD